MANVTAAADELVAALRVRAETDPTRFTLLVPATAGVRGGREAARQRLGHAVEVMRANGLEVEGRVGDSDPLVAVEEVWDPMAWDAIVVSTLPTTTSKWLQIDLPRRVERIADVPVTHVVAREPRKAPAGEPVPERERWGVLSPLRGLLWGRSESQVGSESAPGSTRRRTH